MIYLIFGANVFILSWIDNVLIFLIKHLVSNMAAFFFFWQPFVFLYLIIYSGANGTSLEFSEFHLLMIIFGLAVTGYTWDMTMYQSVGAIRYLDPSWSEVADGERLWPSIAYMLGLVDKNSASSQPAQET